MHDRIRRNTPRTSHLPIGLGVMFGLTISSFAADDFWAVKKPSDWSQQEILRLLTQSPWAKQTRLKSGIVAQAAPISGKELLQGPQGPLPAGAGGAGVPLPAGDPKLSPAGSLLSAYVVGDPYLLANAIALVEANAPLSNPGASPTRPVSASFSDTLIVRWESALPVREGKRMIVTNRPDGDRDVDSYVICVIGGSIRWDQADEGARQRMRQSAELLRKNRGSIRATDAEFYSVEDTSIIRFYFSRKIPIMAGDKEVIFRMEFGVDVIEVKFVLKEMTYLGSLTL